MAGSLKLNDSDIKSAMIAIAIAAAGGLYYRYKKGSGSGTSNLFGANSNINSASSGSAGAIAPSSSINTYNVFPATSSQQSTRTQFYNGGASNNTPSSIHANTSTSVTHGQAFSLPVKG